MVSRNGKRVSQPSFYLVPRCSNGNSSFASSSSHNKASASIKRSGAFSIRFSESATFGGGLGGTLVTVTAKFAITGRFTSRTRVSGTVSVTERSSTDVICSSGNVKFVGTSGAQAKTPHPKAHHRKAHLKSVTRSCPEFNDGAVLVDFTKVRTTNLSCTNARVIEKKLAPPLRSGTGPSRVVKVGVFKCTATYHGLDDPNGPTGHGLCMASRGRRLGFVATNYRQ